MMQFLAAAAVLLASATTPAAPTKGDEPERSADNDDKKICKRFTETGSLVRGYRACKTKREWERERDTARAFGNGINSCRDMAEKGGC
ncbi:hypothetical protein [Novosphingobium sp. 9U]|uniref:hypothetical protein n=1 Tax=Novosphingobium sp. 9U TaxID=2653158 RepID=UPI0012EF68C3|nr:hypothetical protein [Novosphingobium sp. 9U]VWX46973.1 conserved exported hypothetical protein [Novosphingobium sp. 9U]